MECHQCKVIEIISIAFSCALLGFIAGTIRKDYLMLKLCRDQQKRGDYWFDKYMLAVKHGWQPLDEDAGEEWKRDQAYEGGAE